MTTEAVHGGLMSETGAGRRLIERRDHRLVCEEIGVPTLPSDGFETIGDLEEVEELVPFEILERKDVASGKATHACPPSGWLDGLVIP
jgi:hypothetical protein